MDRKARRWIGGHPPSGGAASRNQRVATRYVRAQRRSDVCTLCAPEDTVMVHDRRGFVGSLLVIAAGAAAATVLGGDLPSTPVPEPVSTEAS
jgi:hypothetical protein